MARLSAKKRAELKPSQFGLPEKARTKKARKEPGNHPMPDNGHAISACVSPRRTTTTQPVDEGIQAHLSQREQNPQGRIAARLKTRPQPRERK